MADITNVKVGTCDVYFNGVHLGHTKGGVEVSYEPEYHEVAVDAYGNTPVEKYLIGERLTAVVPLAEYTIANLNKAIPQSTTAGAGSARITIGSKAGKAAKVDSAQLILHPVLVSGATNDIVFYKAYVDSVVTLAHRNDEEKLIEVTFIALLDESKSDGNYLGLIGDSSA